MLSRLAVCSLEKLAILSFVSSSLTIQYNLRYRITLLGRKIDYYVFLSLRISFFFFLVFLFCLFYHPIPFPRMYTSYFYMRLCFVRVRVCILYPVWTCACVRVRVYAGLCYGSIYAFNRLFFFFLISLNIFLMSSVIIVSHSVRRSV